MASISYSDVAAILIHFYRQCLDAPDIALAATSCRRKGYEMGSKDLKRLDLRLPPDHSIFKIEAGQRAKVARDWLDTGVKISGMEERLANMEKQLAEIKEMISKVTMKVEQENPTPSKQDKAVVNQANIGKMFEEAFS
jgi:hypothetical protein